MQKRHRGFHGLVTITAAMVIMGASAMAADQARTIRMVRGEDVDAQLFDTVVSYAQGNLSLTLEVAERPVNLGDKPKSAQAEELAKLRKQGDACVVALLNEPPKLEGQSVLLATNAPVAVVNISSIRSRAQQWPNATDRDVVLLAQKETMRAVGLLLGLKDCPNPQCAMTTMMPKTGRPEFGCNYCPPCRGKVEERFPPRAAVKQPRSK